MTTRRDCLNDAAAKLDAAAKKYKPPANPVSGPLSAVPRPPAVAASQVPRVPDRLPYPSHRLPAVVRAVAEDAAAAIGCEVALAAMPALTLTGAAAGAALEVELKARYRQSPGLWTCTVCDSGTAKSVAARPFLDAAHKLADEAEAEHAEALEDHDRLAEDYEAALARWKEGKVAGENAGDKPRPPVRPAKPYFVTENTTTERLIADLADSPRGLLLMRDELDGHFGGMKRYANGGDDSPVYLSLFEGSAMTFRRKTGDPNTRDIRIRRPFLALDGGIQPSTLVDLLARNRNLLGNGMMARFLFSFPPKLCPPWNDNEPDYRLEADFYEMLRVLRKLPYDPRSGPGRVRLDAEGRALFVAFNDAVMARANGIDGGPLAAALAKFPRHAARLALVHHAATEAAAGRDAGRGCVSVESVAAGVELAKWHLREWERLCAYFGMTEEQRAGAGLAEYVRRKGGSVTVRDLQRSNPDKYPSSDAARLALEALAQSGAGTWRQQGRAEAFVLNEVPAAE